MAVNQPTDQPTGEQSSGQLMGSSRGSGITGVPEFRQNRYMKPHVRMSHKAKRDHVSEGCRELRG